jgi:argininosuccinate lyase
MAHQIDELIKRIKELEEEIEVEFQKKREDIHFFAEKNGSASAKK